MLLTCLNCSVCLTVSSERHSLPAIEATYFHSVRFALGRLNRTNEAFTVAVKGSTVTAVSVLNQAALFGIVMATLGERSFLQSHSSSKRKQSVTRCPVYFLLFGAHQVAPTRCWAVQVNPVAHCLGARACRSTDSSVDHRATHSPPAALCLCFC